MLDAHERRRAPNLEIAAGAAARALARTIWQTIEEAQTQTAPLIVRSIRSPSPEVRAEAEALIVRLERALAGYLAELDLAPPAVAAHSRCEDPLRASKQLLATLRSIVATCRQSA